MRFLLWEWPSMPLPDRGWNSPGHQPGALRTESHPDGDVTVDYRWNSDQHATPLLENYTVCQKSVHFINICNPVHGIRIYLEPIDEL
jgi:hypothetical protein